MHFPPHDAVHKQLKSLVSVYNHSKNQHWIIHGRYLAFITAFVTCQIPFLPLAGLPAMKLSVLGCAGGIGGRERYTTCLLVDDDILLDAGTGIATLDLDALARIDHIFVTHTHLDHVAGLALLVDATQGKRSTPLTIHATDAVIDVLKTHMFNWKLWPDFGEIPSATDPAMRWERLAHGDSVTLGGRTISSHAVEHTEGSAAYAVSGADGKGFLFTGDMCSTPALWSLLDRAPGLTHVIVDCSFANAEVDLAKLSMHFCPSTLMTDLADVPTGVEFLIYHLKPGQEDLIMQELQAGGGGRPFRALGCGDVLAF